MLSGKELSVAVKLQPLVKSSIWQCGKRYGFLLTAWRLIVSWESALVRN